MLLSSLFLLKSVFLKQSSKTKCFFCRQVSVISVSSNTAVRHISASICGFLASNLRGLRPLAGIWQATRKYFPERKMSRICYTVCLNRFNHKQRPTGQFQTNTARKSYIFFYNIYLWPLAPCPLETTSSPYFSF